MLAARGILTSRGGRTSHAALVARQFGKPAVVGVLAMEVDVAQRVLRVGGRELRQGDPVSVDGTVAANARAIHGTRTFTLVPPMSVDGGTMSHVIKVSWSLKRVD